MKLTMPTDLHELAWLTQIAISAHCSINSYGRSTQGFGVWYSSTVSHLLAETRHASGFEYCGKLLPLLGALSAMDQYGTCYEPNPTTFPAALASKSGIIKSAHNFLKIPVNTPDSDALFALRNALMHQSSLISVGKQATPKHYWFEVDNSIATLFTHAKSAWDGSFNTRDTTNKTVVNAAKVLDLAVALTNVLTNEHKQGKLKLVLANGLDELLTDYVELDFDTSFRHSYLKYLSVMIYNSLNSPPAGALLAKQIIAGVSPRVVDEAAIALAQEISGQQLAKLTQAYPSVIPKS